jgi:tRNA G18 (ribose-2'-O)-methylase SpoU
MIKLGAKELRTTEPSAEDLKKIKKNPLYIILDNVLDTYNVGSIFRLADAVAAKKIFLCGQTETPPNPRIKKASVSTWKWVEWEYAASAREALQKLQNSKTQKLKIYVTEQHPKSVPYHQVDYQLPCVVVVGNETEGVSQEVLKMADEIVEIPMFGVNKSLNVMVSLGIVLFEIMKKIGLTKRGESAILRPAMR